MQLSTGLWDSLLGKRMTLQLPRPDGPTRRVTVTEAWFKKMVAEGKIMPTEGSSPEKLLRARRIQDGFHSALQAARSRVPNLVPPEQCMRLVFWLADVPQAFFDYVFALNANDESYVPVLVNAEREVGAECAAITQGYSLWLLQQLLSNDPGFRAAMGFDTAEAERVAVLTLPQTVLSRLASYRARFDLKKLEVDPRDWPIVWLWDVTDALIQDPASLKRAMGSWNDDLLARTAYVGEMVHLMVELKKWALQL